MEPTRLFELGGCPVGGYLPVRALTGDDLATWLEGRTVTMMLHDGTIVTGVQLQPFDHALHARRFGYRLPAGTCWVPTSAVAHLYVHYRRHDRPGISPRPITIHVGDCPPTIVAERA